MCDFQHVPTFPARSHSRRWLHQGEDSSADPRCRAGGSTGGRQLAASPCLLWEPRVSSVLLGDWSSGRVWWPHCICEEVCGWGWVLWRAMRETQGGW